MNYCTRIPEHTINAVDRIIVIGDIHGDINGLLKVLVKTKLIDHKSDWIGGNTLVQLGDILDRSKAHGSETDIFRLFVKITKQSHMYGGDVHLILGNHEIMNLQGNYKYVGPHGDIELRHDLRSYLACNALSALKIGSWLFTHAGIQSKITQQYSINDLNAKVRSFILNPGFKLSDSLMSFFWQRETPSCIGLEKGLKDWHSDRVVIGHNKVDKAISKCKGRLWMIDTGHVGVLEIRGGGRHVPRTPWLSFKNNGK
jgi:hypothetical protein